MSTPFRWGILGTGGIAHKFATGVGAVADAQLAAVGSRTQESADRFADQYHIPVRHPSYEALANDPNIDAIYIATPHNLHCENTLMCLDAGKPVLVEKPFAINWGEAQQMVAKAREKKIFLMEAMWTRYLPVIARAKQLVTDGVIGDVRMVMADFGFRTGVNEEGRLFNPHFGGGGLLDVGIYPVSLAYFILGAPSAVTGFADLGETGVDEQAAWLFNYPEGQLAMLSSAIRTNTPHEARICGTNGMIRIPDWWHASQMTLSVGGKADEVIDLPLAGNGYNYEAEEVARCVRAGELESPVMTLDESLAIMGTLDTIRAQWGLKYPME